MRKLFAFLEGRTQVYHNLSQYFIKGGVFQMLFRVTFLSLVLKLL